MIRVDYRCPSCGGRAEQVVSSPPPPRMPCPSCQASALRVFSMPARVGRAPSPPSSALPVRASAAACNANPDIPGLCHLSPSAQNVLVARARGDNRALERELARQEHALREHPGESVNPIGGHGHGHGDGHGHGATAQVDAPGSPPV